MDSTFVRSGRGSHWYNTESVRVQYSESVWSVCPRAAVEWHPFKNAFLIEATAGIPVAFSERGEVSIRAENGSHWSYTKIFTLANPGITATYGSDKITSTPFRFQALQFGVRIGFTIRTFRLVKKD